MPMDGKDHFINGLVTGAAAGKTQNQLAQAEAQRRIDSEYQANLARQTHSNQDAILRELQEARRREEARDLEARKDRHRAWLQSPVGQKYLQLQEWAGPGLERLESRDAKWRSAWYAAFDSKVERPIYPDRPLPATSTGLKGHINDLAPFVVMAVALGIFVLAANSDATFSRKFVVILLTGAIGFALSGAALAVSEFRRDRFEKCLQQENQQTIEVWGSGNQAIRSHYADEIKTRFGVDFPEGSDVAERAPWNNGVASPILSAGIKSLLNQPFEEIDAKLVEIPMAWCLARGDSPDFPDRVLILLSRFRQEDAAV